MGIVFKQALQNTILTYAAFVIGGVNVLFLYTNFLTDSEYGLVIFLLSTANLLMPLTAFGVQHAIVKFYSSYKDKTEKDKFLSSALLLPLFIAIPIGFIGNLFYEQIRLWLSHENPMIKNYTFIIYFIAILTAYFEVFYAWSKVQLQSVFGNFIKEMFSRIATMVLLILIYYKYIDFQQFIYLMTFAYLLRMLIMLIYALSLYKPKFSLALPSNYKEILTYAFFIILAGSAGSIVLDIDKFMIPQKTLIADAAYYAVAVFIGSVIEAPGRAMSQIVQPLTAKAINEENHKEIASLYKKSSINLLLISGLIFLLVNVNVKQLYLLIDEKYAQGVWVVLMISTAKLYHMFLGNNGAIISNSKYYKILLPYAVSVAISVVVLNYWLIDLIGINGAGLATLIVILVYNTVKIWYVKRKFGILPFTNKTATLLAMLLVFFGLFYFWEFPFHPIVNIFLKSTILGVLYLVLALKLRIAPEATQIWHQFKGFFLKK